MWLSLAHRLLHDPQLLGLLVLLNSLIGLIGIWASGQRRRIMLQSIGMLYLVVFIFGTTTIAGLIWTGLIH